MDREFEVVAVQRRALYNTSSYTCILCVM